MEAPIFHYPQTPEIATKIQDKRTHVTELPRGFLIVRIMQLLFSMTVLGLLAFNFAEHQGGTEAFVGIISAAIGTVLYGWIMLTYCVPSIYNYWAVITSEIVTFLLWIDAFVWLLLNTFTGYDYDSYWDNCSKVDDGSYGYYYTCNPRYNYTLVKHTAIASAAFAGAEIVLSFISLIIVSVFIARHRAAGGHNKPGSAAPTHMPHENEKLIRSEVEL